MQLNIIKCNFESKEKNKFGVLNDQYENLIWIV